MVTLPETNSSPLKMGQAPKGNDRIPTIHFQVRKMLLVQVGFRRISSTEKIQSKDEIHIGRVVSFLGGSTHPLDFLPFRSRKTGWQFLGGSLSFSILVLKKHGSHTSGKGMSQKEEGNASVWKMRSSKD